jgi:predicted aminopeptidase
VQASRGQFDILWRRMPVSEALQDPNLKPDHRRNLLFLEEVRQFALEAGLNAGKMYTSYTRIDRDAAAYNVTASAPLKLEARTWWFPIVGTVPYLGFFEKSRAEEKERELIAEGYDTRVRRVPAYSTLGWFDDPVLSSQLDCSELCLSRVFLHEAAHATLWLKGSVNFNESFASFVEDQATRQFWLKKEGPASKTVRLIDLLDKESKQLTQIMQQCHKNLQSLYENQEQTRAEMLISKKKMVLACKKNVSAANFRAMRLDGWLAEEWNNTHFLAYARYRSGDSFFNKKFTSCNNDWPCFFHIMESISDLSVSDREKALAEE